MNKQELIKRIEVLPYTEGPIADTITINRNWILKSIEQLDEPEMGHADEAPRYVKNILPRLRELPLHNREVWLNAIMGEFEKDFSHSKWREGYEQGKFEGKYIPEKVKVPQFVANWIANVKRNGFKFRNSSRFYEEIVSSDDVYRVMYYILKESIAGEAIRIWVNANRDAFARAWLDGYEVEKEKRYKVVMLNIASSGGVLTRIKHDDSWIWIDTLGTIVEGRTHTRKELENAGFGWVFDCPGLEVEEVEE